MNYTLGHLRDDVLHRDLNALVAQDRKTTVLILAHIAEFDTRRLFVPAGYPSMHAYCVEELRLSDDAAFRRIRAARAGRSFPSVFDALAGGQLHLAAVSLLAPHLTKENVEELIEAATHKRKAEIEEFLARRFGQPEVPAKVRILPVSDRPQLVPGRVGSALPLLASPDLAEPQGAPARVESDAAEAIVAAEDQQRPIDELAPGRIEGVKAEPEPEPASAQRYLVQFTISKNAHDKLQYARALLSHAVPVADVGQVLERALVALIPRLEKRKFSGRKPRSDARPKERARRRENEPKRGRATAGPTESADRCTGSARCLGAGQRAMHVRQRRWHTLRDAPLPGIRSHRSCCPRRKGDHRSAEAAMQNPQPI